MKTQSIGPFITTNNRLPDTEMRVSTRQVSGNYLRSSANVDIDNAGKLRRRESELLIQAMTGAHSLRMTSDTTGYLVRGSVLYSVTLPNYAETFAKALTSNDTMSWVTVGDDLYFSNGTDSGRITQGLFFPLGLPTPDAPACTTVGGSLFAGTYQVAVSYFNSVTGEEGGISASSNPALAAVGGLRVTLPAATTGATHANAYLSTVNGAVPMLAATVALGAAATDIVIQPTPGRESNGRYEEPLPAGTLFSSNGRLCSFSGSTVYVGLPFRPGYYLPADGYIPFPADVSIAIENQGGTFIAADKTYWLPGDLGNVEGPLRDVLPYGAVPGTEFKHPTDSTVGWFGADGFVLAGIDGSVKAVMSDNIDLTAPDTGCSTVRATNGYLRVISCGWCLNLENMAATRYTDFDFTALSGEYGIKADGIYAMTGGGDVPWLADFGKQDFGSEYKKRVPAVYLGSASRDPLEIRIQTEEEEDYTYPARSCSDTLQQHRVDPGKGLRSNWFNLSLLGGCDFTLASVSFAPAVSGRRI